MGSDKSPAARLRPRRWLLVGGIAIVVASAIVIGEGMTGMYDRYFDVKLANQSGHVVTVDNHGTEARLLPGASDQESGSSTVHGHITVSTLGLRRCVNLFFKTRPERPLAISLRSGRLVISGAPNC